MSNKIADYLSTSSTTETVILKSVDTVNDVTWVLCYKAPAGSDPGGFYLAHGGSHASILLTNFNFSLEPSVPEDKNNPDDLAQYALQWPRQGSLSFAGNNQVPSITPSIFYLNIYLLDLYTVYGPNHESESQSPECLICYGQQNASASCLTVGTPSVNWDTATVEWEPWAFAGIQGKQFPADTPPKQKWVFITGTGVVEP